MSYASGTRGTGRGGGPEAPYGGYKLNRPRGPQEETITGEPGQGAEFPAPAPAAAVTAPAANVAARMAPAQVNSLFTPVASTAARRPVASTAPAVSTPVMRKRPPHPANAYGFA